MAVFAGVDDGGEPVGLRRLRRQLLERHIGGRAQQRRELDGAVDIEQHDLAAVVGQFLVQRAQDGGRAHGEVDHRLKGQHRRQRAQPAGARQPVDLRLQGIGQPVRLPRAIDRERVVLERVELRRDAEPGRVGKRRQHRRQAGKAGETRKPRDPDHGGEENQAVGPGQHRILDHVQRILHRERAAVGETHQVQGRRRRHAAPGLAHAEPRGGHPVFPAHVAEAGWHGAMARHAHPDHDKTAIAVQLGDVAQAVR